MKECWTLWNLKKKQKSIGIPHDSTKTGNIEIIKQVFFFQSEWKVESSCSVHGKEKYGSCFGKQQLIS